MRSKHLNVYDFLSQYDLSEFEKLIFVRAIAAVNQDIDELRIRIHGDDVTKVEFAHLPKDEQEMLDKLYAGIPTA